MKKHFTWENFNRIITSTQFSILILGIIFTIFQIQDIKNNQLNRKNDLAIRYYDKLDSAVNRQITLVVEHKKPLLVSNKGKFTEDQLDNYLGWLHDIGRGLNSGLLDKDTVCSSFSDLVTNAWQNQEIQEYLLKIRKISPMYFSGFNNLNTFIESCE